jgi:hypothetical protein
MEKITLPVQMVAEMYKHSLYNIASPAGETPITAKTGSGSTAAPTLAFLGGNNRRVLLLVNEPEATHIDSGALETLTKILGACKLTLADVAILNIHEKNITWPLLKEQFKPQQCLLFGVGPEAAGLPVVFPPYHTHPFDGCHFILSAPPAELDRDALQKSKLWLCLKALFQL